MNRKQRDSIAKYLYDISKGALLAVVVGVGTQQLSLVYALLYGLLALYALLAAYYLEQLDDE